MNKLKGLAVAFFSLLTMTACGGSDSNSPAGIDNAAITCTPEQLTAKAAGDKATLQVSTTKKEWTAYTDASWVKLSLNGTAKSAGTIDVIVDKNTGTEARSTNITIKSGAARKQIIINQLAPLQVSEREIQTNSTGETRTVQVTSAEEWTVTTSDSWITVAKIDAKSFNVATAKNDAHEARTGKIILKTPTQTLDVTVSQSSVDDRTMNIPAGYSLVWHDEFDGTGLSSAWTHEVQKSGWVNHEQQNYVNNSNVTYLKDGKLNITCYKASDGKIYSGRIYANKNTGIKYGYVEARILLPSGKGTWPAFWMMPVKFSTWPGDGEIDIMEEVGVVPNEVSSSIHCNAYNHVKGTQKTHAMTISKAEGDYHVYALEWTENSIKTYVDGKEQLYFPNDGKGNNDTWPFNKEFYVILNLAWGGDWGGMKGTDETALPATMKVDYVRVFQKK
ncbi:MAG: family 16 glycosylhydrolase [Prevotella sp.]|nr:family 16 glycosylhydrolase [Prevotella sp.]